VCQTSHFLNAKSLTCSICCLVDYPDINCTPPYSAGSSTPFFHATHNSPTTTNRHVTAPTFNDLALRLTGLAQLPCNSNCHTKSSNCVFHPAHDPERRFAGCTAALSAGVSAWGTSSLIPAQQTMCPSEYNLAAQGVLCIIYMKIQRCRKRVSLIHWVPILSSCPPPSSTPPTTRWSTSSSFRTNGFLALRMSRTNSSTTPKTAWRLCESDLI